MRKILVLALVSFSIIACNKTTNGPVSYQTIMQRMGVTMGQAYTSGHYSGPDTTGTVTFFNDTSIEEYSNAAHRSVKFSCHFFLDSSKVGYLNACYVVKDSAKLASDIGTDAYAFPFATLALHKLELVNYSSALILGGTYGFPARGIVPASCDYITTH